MPLPGNLTPEERVSLRYAVVLMEAAEQAAARAAAYLREAAPGGHLDVDLVSPATDALSDALAEARALENDVEYLARHSERSHA